MHQVVAGVAQALGHLAHVVQRIGRRDFSVTVGIGFLNLSMFSSLHLRLLLVFLMATTTRIVFADDAVRVFVDANGIVHLTNIPDLNRFEVQVPVIGAQPVRGQHMSALPLEQRPFHDHVKQASRDTGLDSALLHAVISVESGYNHKALSPKGARGLMQLLPTTAHRYGARNLFDPAENIGAGARYLRDLMRLFNNDLELSLAAYNAGENAILRHGNRVPPYLETQRYVPLVLARYRSFSSGNGVRIFAQ